MKLSTKDFIEEIDKRLAEIVIPETPKKSKDEEQIIKTINKTPKKSKGKEKIIETVNKTSTYEDEDRTCRRLMNLRCKKLHHFQRYKNIFYTNVFRRKDANHPFWKELFISGLPRSFAEQIRRKIRDRNAGVIPYEKLTFGDISSIITEEIFSLWNYMKALEQLEREVSTFKNGKEGFIEKFTGCTSTLKPPSSSIKKYSKMSEIYHEKQFQQTPQYYHKPKTRKCNSYKPKETEERTLTCLKCGRKTIICLKCGRKRTQ